MSFLVNSYRFAPSAPPFTFGNALLFDGVDDIVTLSALPASTVFTASWWFKWDGSQSSIMVGANSAIHYLGYFINTSPSILRVRLNTQTGFNFSTSFDDNQWHHIMIAFDNAVGMNVYIDGVDSNDGTKTQLNGTTFALDRVGGRNGSIPFKGVLDEFAFIDGVVGTSQNAIDLYNGGNGAYISDVFPSQDVSYRFSESGTDTTAVDDSGNGRNGTLQNFPASGMWIPH